MVLNNYIELLTSPATFFRKMDRVKNYFDPWFFFIIFGLFEVIIQLPIVIVDYASIGSEDALISLISTVVGFALLPVTPFIAAGIAHIGMLILGHDGFYKTYKPLTYSLTISVPYSLGIILLTAIMMAVTGTSVELPTTEGAIAILLLTVPIFILAIASVVHTVYAASAGAAHTHKISKLRAFVGMYIIPSALLFALGIVIAIIFLIFFVGIMAIA